MAVAAGEAVGIVAPTTPELIVTATALQAVGAIRAQDDVVARAGLIPDGPLHQGLPIPRHAIAEQEARQRPVGEGSNHGDLIATGREANQQIGTVDGREAHQGIGGTLVGEIDDGTADPVGALDPVDAVAGLDDHLAVAGENDAVMAAAGTDLGDGRKLAGVDAVLGVRLATGLDQGPRLGDGELRAIGEDVAFHRTGAVAPQHHQPVAARSQADQQIAVQMAERHHVRADAGAELNAVDAAAVLNAVAAVVESETIEIISPATSHRIGTSTARDGVGPVVETNQIVIRGSTAEHAIDQRL